MRQQRSVHRFAEQTWIPARRIGCLAKNDYPGKRKAPHIRFYKADICTWNFPKKYDFVSAWDSTWHLPLNRQEPVLQRICGGLTHNGVFIFTTGGLDAPGEKLDSLMGVKLSYSALGIPKTLKYMRCASTCANRDAATNWDKVRRR